jgi:hypothetical protein
MIKLKNMCDRCFRILGDNEPMFGFKLIDDEENVRALKGHEGCVKEMAEIIQQIYGKSELNEEGTENQE